MAGAIVWIVQLRSMEELQRVAIHLVTWNHRGYLPAFFSSLAAHHGPMPSVTVVDNASHDGTLDWLHEHHPEVVVLRNFRNQGFARAHNQAIALSLSRWPEETWQERFILIANPNLLLDPMCLERLQGVLQTDQTIGVAVPKIARATCCVNTEDEQPEIQYTTEIDSCGLIITRGRRILDRGAGQEDRGQFDEPVDVFGFSSTCALFRASVFAQLKLGTEWFDEDFVSAGLDADASWRLQRVGQRVRAVPQAHAWHHHPLQQRASARSADRRMMMARNQLWMIIKHDDIPNVLLHLPWIFVVQVLRGCISLAHLKGMIEAVLLSWKMLRKRFELSRRAVVSAAVMRKWFV